MGYGKIHDMSYDTVSEDVSCGRMWAHVGARVGSYVCALYLTQFGEIGRSREGNGRGYLVRAIV